jgi:hypothetical protein
VFYFPNPHLGHGKADFVFRIHTAKGSSWYAALPQQGLGWGRRAFVMPDRASVYVDGYVIRAESPLDWHRIELDSIIDCAWTQSDDYVVFLGRHGITVYGPDGPCWRRLYQHLYLHRLVSIDQKRILVQGEIDEDVVGKFPSAFSFTHGTEMHD